MLFMVLILSFAVTAVSGNYLLGRIDRVEREVNNSCPRATGTRPDRRKARQQQALIEVEARIAHGGFSTEPWQVIGPAQREIRLNRAVAERMKLQSRI